MEKVYFLVVHVMVLIHDNDIQNIINIFKVIKESNTILSDCNGENLVTLLQTTCTNITILKAIRNYLDQCQVT